MTSRDFCYWLQGFFELAEGQSGMSHEQAEAVRKHLALVFKHEIDPSHGDETHQAELSAIHDGKPLPTKEDVEKAVEKAVSKLPRPHDPNRRIMC